MFDAVWILNATIIIKKQNAPSVCILQLCGKLIEHHKLLQLQHQLYYDIVSENQYKENLFLNQCFKSLKTVKIPRIGANLSGK